MDKNTPSARALDVDLRVISELREELSRHEQLRGKNMACLLPELGASVFMPAVQAGVIEHFKICLKIRKVEAVPSKPSDIATRLRSAWFGRFYTNHLKQYALVHQVVMWLWRNGYPVYVNHVAILVGNKKAKRWRQLTRLSEFAKKNGIPTCKLVDAALVEIPVPKVFPVSDQCYLESPHDRNRFPEIIVATINSATIYGGTNLVLVDGEVVCHDLYDFNRDSTSEELHGRTLINPKSGRVRWLMQDETPESVAVAATFVDACAANYAHWMTEVLPRIALFCAEEQFHGVAIVVNDGLHKNIMESLFLVAGAEREIITLPIGRALAFNVLYLTSVTGYVPFGQRTNKLAEHSHGLFSPHALELLRDTLIAIPEEGIGDIWPEKIFLRRNSGTRKVINAAEVERMLVTEGYVIVETDKLTFMQQIQIFKNARMIISATGAALANAVFCKPGTQVAVLMSKHENMIYRYWSNMLAPIQVKVSYVLGNIVENRDLGIHGDFLVEAGLLNDLLVSFGEK
jgi:capsular polysaccharide biosynthesis protein